MCPSGDDRALDMAMPLLQKVAARDARGNPCVGRCGMGGSGSTDLALLHFLIH